MEHEQVTPQTQRELLACYDVGLNNGILKYVLSECKRI